MAKSAKNQTELSQPIGNEDLPVSQPADIEKAFAHIENMPGVDDEFETIVSGASFKEFEDGEVFDCIYTGSKSIREEDVVDNKGNVIHHKGDIMGYLVKDRKTGEESILGNAWAINKAFTEGNFQAGDKLRITFLGKTENASGQPLNLFKIQRAIVKK